jgi:hypothetical protein
MIKVKKIKKDFTGTVLSTDHSRRGREFEEVLERSGFRINTGAGVDIPDYDLEVKTKDINSTSPNSVASMTYEDICNKNYEQSGIFEKVQRQFRVKTDNGTVIDQEIFDFSRPFIQDVIKDAYESARAKMIQGDKSSYISGSAYGCFEQKAENSWTFRISVPAMKKLEGMSKSTFDKLFDYDN